MKPWHMTGIDVNDIVATCIAAPEPIGFASHIVSHEVAGAIIAFCHDPPCPLYKPFHLMTFLSPTVPSVSVRVNALCCAKLDSSPADGGAARDAQAGGHAW